MADGGWWMAQGTTLRRRWTMVRAHARCATPGASRRVNPQHFTSSLNVLLVHTLRPGLCLTTASHPPARPHIRTRLVQTTGCDIGRDPSSAYRQLHSSSNWRLLSIAIQHLFRLALCHCCTSCLRLTVASYAWTGQLHCDRDFLRPLHDSGVIRPSRRV